MYRTVCLLLILLLLPVKVLAQPGIAWGDLSAEQREMLAPLEDEWNRMPPRRQRDILNGAQRLQGMSVEEREEAQQRFRDWTRRSPEQQERIRDRYERFRGLEPDQQREIRERFRDFQNMPENRRRNLREQFQNRPPSPQRP